MKLKENVDMKKFLETANQCSGSVFFQTTEGDILNLKSLLSRYVLMSIMGNPGLIKTAQIICTQEEEYQKLADYLEESE